MTSFAPLGAAMMLLVLSLALGLVLIPIIDAALQREIARANGTDNANDNKEADHG